MREVINNMQYMISVGDYFNPKLIINIGFMLVFALIILSWFGWLIYDEVQWRKRLRKEGK